MTFQLANAAGHTRDLASLLPTQLLSEEQAGIEVSGIQNDSRKVVRGDLFLALPGIQTDGSRYIKQAMEKGAAAILMEADSNYSDSGNGSIKPIAIEKLSQQSGQIAARFYGEPSSALNVVAITGTNGKTSCGRIIAELAEQLGHKCMVIGTTGYGFPNHLDKASHTTPDAIELQKLLAWGKEQGAEMVSMEVSSHGLAQNRLSGVEVNTAIFTNLTRDHLDYHGSMESYGDAKRKLFLQPGLNHAIINLDDSFGRELLQDLSTDISGLSYSLISKEADIYANKIDSATGIFADIKTPWGEGKINSALLGEFNLSNLLAAIAALCVSGVALDKVLVGIESLKPIEGRMESFGGEKSQPIVIVDFAHTPDALEKALAQLQQMNHEKLICVFGCGGDRDKGKRPLMGSVAAQYCDHLIVTDDNPRNENPKDITNEIISSVKGLVTHEVIHDRCDAIKSAIHRAGQRDIVLVAGKGHEQTQEYATSSIHFCDRTVVQEILNGDATNV